MEKICTPYLKIDLEKLVFNIKSMEDFSRRNGLSLRPHFKTHKTPEIAKMQKENGAIGFTVSKISEAEILVKHGFDDILIAYPIVGGANIKRVLKLSENCKISVAMDDLESIRALGEGFFSNKKEIELLMEIDSGLNRLGVKPSEALDRAKELNAIPGIKYMGIMTHAGHAYGASNLEEVESIGIREGEIMANLKGELERHGIHTTVVSVGSTPTVLHSGKIQGVTEIRPGNYVFYDSIQVQLGTTVEERCSLVVVSTVIGKPTEDRLVLDAGSKTLALDAGAHGKSTVKGYGKIKGHRNLIIERLSEEHGIVTVEGSTSLKPGDKVEIIPNHSCPVVNLSENLYVYENNKLKCKWSVEARGRNW